MFKGISALSRGILKTKKGKNTTHFNGDSTNTELLFQTVHSVNQLSIYGAAANWCKQFGLAEEEKGRDILSADKKMLTSIPPEEVQLLVSLPTMALGNGMRENIVRFETLSSSIQLTQLCEKAHFQHRVTAGKKYKTRPHGDDSWRTVTTLCREYKCSRAFPESCVLAAIPERTTIGPVIEVRIVKVLEECAIEISIPSIVNPVNILCVDIQRNRALCG